MRIRPRLALLFAGVGVLAVAVTSFVNYIMAEASLKVTVANQLVGLRSAKARHIESAFRDFRRTVEVKASDVSTLRALESFREALAKSNVEKVKDAYLRRPAKDQDRSQIVDPGDGSPYTAVHKLYHPNLHDFRLSLGVSDVFLCDSKTGQVLYTDRKGTDFVTHLSNAELAPSGLADAVARAVRNERPAISDLRPYSASHNYPAAFLAAPIRSGGVVEGVLVIQIGLAQIDSLATPDTASREGLGDTGETLILGPDLTLRNDSHGISHMQALKEDLKAQGLSAEKLRAIEQSKSTVLAFPMGKDYEVALQGDGYMETINYRGKKVLAAYEAMSIPGLHWALVVEQDQAEAYEPLVGLQRSSMLAGLGMLLVTLLLAYLVSGSFTRPLSRLSEAAKRFGEGETGVRVGLSGQDEYGALGRAFDQMVTKQEQFDHAAAAIRRNIVHDLKTPVAVIKGMAETLDQPGVADDADLRAELVETIGQESDRLLDDLQDILQPVTSSYEPQLEEFDLSRLVMVTANLERHTSRAGRHKITVHGADKSVIIRADRRKIRRALENLVGNAVKYSPGEGKEVTLILEATPEMAIVTVQDQGLGMTESQLADVLEKGGRVQDHANMGIEGTGFGLGSVKQILKAHGGELGATSEPGKGSTFTVKLPRSIP